VQAQFMKVTGCTTYTTGPEMTVQVHPVLSSAAQVREENFAVVSFSPWLW